MAGTSTKTKVVGVRLPLDLLDWVETQGETKDVVIRALTALKDGLKPAVADPRVAELEAALVTQKALTAKWQKAAQSVMPMADRKPEKPTGKLVADALPLAGDQFPEQETWWQKRQRTNAGKATKAG